jgi:N6-adenosine-specific RNA methylase IME4
VTAKYRTLVADPPWHYEAFATSPSSGKMRHNDPLPYPSMTEEEILGLGSAVRRLIAPGGAFLFLWTTNRYLPLSFDVMAAWGFRYRQTITWHKTGSPSPFGGTVAPPHSEFLLVGRRGGNVAMVGERFPSSVIAAPSQRRHSQKPELFLDLIERVAPGPYVELFARRQRLGWDTWGNEALAHVDLEGRNSNEEAAVDAA